MGVKLYNEIEERFIKYVEEHQSELYTCLSELVKIDTVNYKTYGNENNGQDYLEKICKDLGLKVDRFAPESISGLSQHRDYMPGRSADKRDDLVAILEGQDKSKSVMLASHMDTETFGPIEKWNDDPFSGIIKDGKIYGRGAGDDKSGIAISWFIMKAFKDLGIVPKKNIVLGSYSDEEGGGGNGALALALKYPSDFCISLDSSGFETEALGGGCFRLVLNSYKKDKSIASVFDVFEGVNKVVEKLSVLNGQGKTTIRLSSAQAGIGGIKEGVVNIAIYTDMTKEESQDKLDNICKELQDDFKRLSLSTEGFKLTTRYFIYGETPKDSAESKILSEIIRDETGEYPDTKGSCLSDLSLLMAYGCKNSFNYGIPRGSSDGGGAHQPNEHARCDELLKLTKNIALVLLRM